MDNNLILPNLARLGVKRVQKPEADLIIPWLTNYPMHRNYLALCNECTFLTPYGGGKRDNQGKRIPGYILSGYRDELVEKNKESPHMYGVAWDIIVPGINNQIEVLNKSINKELFNRVGVYIDRAFVHVDLIPDFMIKTMNKKKFWIFIEGEYIFFDTYDKIVEELIKHK